MSNVKHFHLTTFVRICLETLNAFLMVSFFIYLLVHKKSWRPTTKSKQKKRTNLATFLYVKWRRRQWTERDRKQSCLRPKNSPSSWNIYGGFSFASLPHVKLAFHRRSKSSWTTAVHHLLANIVNFRFKLVVFCEGKTGVRWAVWTAQEYMKAARSDGGQTNYIRALGRLNAICKLRQTHLHTYTYITTCCGSVYQ